MSDARPRRALPAIVLAVLALAPLAPLAAAAAAGTPPVGGATARATVQSTADRVLAVLRSGAPLDEKRSRLEAIGMETFDFETVSKLVLAKYWKQLSPAQQQEFQQEFRKQLAITYGKRIDRYGNEEVVIVGERTEPRGDVTVQTKVVGSTAANDIKVDYRLRQRPDGSWLFIDVVVEGISIVSSYRSQFQEILSAGGPDRLLGQLREKNAAGEAAVEDPTRPAGNAGSGI
jgi:phospholipid transport system substrate-binding protein